jgi:hypothetical protein
VGHLNARHTYIVEDESREGGEELGCGEADGAQKTRKERETLRNVAVAQDLKKSDAAEVQEDGSLKDGEMAEKAENGMNAAKETEVIGSQ